MTITLTWDLLPWVGLVLLPLVVVGFLTGTLPDQEGSVLGNALRWVSWPLFAIWCLVCFIRGMIP